MPVLSLLCLGCSVLPLSLSSLHNGLLLVMCCLLWHTRRSRLLRLLRRAGWLSSSNWLSSLSWLVLDCGWLRRCRSHRFISSKAGLVLLLTLLMFTALSVLLMCRMGKDDHWLITRLPLHILHLASIVVHSLFVRLVLLIFHLNIFIRSCLIDCCSMFLPL